MLRNTAAFGTWLAGPLSVGNKFLAKLKFTLSGYPLDLAARSMTAQAYYPAYNFASGTSIDSSNPLYNEASSLVRAVTFRLGAESDLSWYEDPYRSTNAGPYLHLNGDSPGEFHTLVLSGDVQTSSQQYPLNLGPAKTSDGLFAMHEAYGCYEYVYFGIPFSVIENRWITVITIKGDNLHTWFNDFNPTQNLYMQGVSGAIEARWVVVDAITGELLSSADHYTNNFNGWDIPVANDSELGSGGAPSSLTYRVNPQLGGMINTVSWNADASKFAIASAWVNFGSTMDPKDPAIYGQLASQVRPDYITVSGENPAWAWYNVVPQSTTTSGSDTYITGSVSGRITHSSGYIKSIATSNITGSILDTARP